VVSKAAIADGVALLLFMMLGLFGSNQVAAIGSVAVVLGGKCRTDRTSVLCSRRWPQRAPPGRSVQIRLD
jgi:hypothetical protein